MRRPGKTMVGAACDDLVAYPTGSYSSTLTALRQWKRATVRPCWQGQERNSCETVVIGAERLLSSGFVRAESMKGGQDVESRLAAVLRNAGQWGTRDWLFALGCQMLYC